MSKGGGYDALLEEFWRYLWPRIAAAIALGTATGLALWWLM